VCGAQAPGRHGVTRVRPERSQRWPSGKLSRPFGLAAAGALMLAVLVGCSQADPPSDESAAASAGSAVSASPLPPDPAASPSSVPAPATATATATGAAGSRPAAGMDPDGAAPSSPAASAGAGASPGAGGGRPGSGVTAAPGAPGGSSGSGGPAGSGGSGAGGGVAAPTVPVPQPSAVFVGEACVPGRNPDPAAAVNGLVLYCVPDESGSGSGGGGAGGRWSTQAPPPPTQVTPQEGGLCQQADVGRIVPNQAGRPLSCLRDPNGALTWSDVS
jgi:hypothetical protein